jgi:very-short-patch-repair endonuclease
MVNDKLIRSDYSPPLGEECYSPPLEGCPQGGVVGVVDSPQGGVLTYINEIPIRRNFITNLPCNIKLKGLLPGKRKAGILSEVLFWLQVHKRKFHNIDFDRQRIIGNYIVDFYVKTLGLVIEIDGSSHDYKGNYDKARQNYLESLGLKVFRIADIDVKRNLAQVMQDLESYIVQEYGNPPRPSGTPPKEGNTIPHPSKERNNHLTNNYPLWQSE